MNDGELVHDRTSTLRSVRFHSFGFKSGGALRRNGLQRFPGHFWGKGVSTDSDQPHANDCCSGLDSTSKSTPRTGSGQFGNRMRLRDSSRNPVPRFWPHTGLR